MTHNQLKNAGSLYLRQHADHPVHWYQWCPEAFEAAQRDNKPILLSIGYAACHWCHVMAHESFQNEEIAEYLNTHFISIKVDREERPDIDEIYMMVVQALNRGNGGWPMTVILTPNAEPIFGGTYFPPGPRAGMPGFDQVLQHSYALYHQAPDKRDRIIEQLSEYLNRATALPDASDDISHDWFQRITESATKDYDHRYGGFGHAPKFPPHGVLASLIAYTQLTQDSGVKALAIGTLNGMAKGGVYDLLGGGFARYSVDEQWRIPHFEKMLADNAQLIPHYLDAFVITKDPQFKAVAIQSLEYTLRELALPNGGFASSQDADSDGVEGRYYCWSRAEAKDVLGADSEDLLDLLQLTKEGTFEENNWSVIRLETPLSHQPNPIQKRLRSALDNLRGARSKRTSPTRDDKLICSWNALLISAFAKAGRLLNEPRYTQVAKRSLSVIKDQLFYNGRLLRRPLQNDVPILAFADDYAALINALIDVVEADFSLLLLQEALQLMNQFIDLFWDSDSIDGGFFYTGSDAPPLIVRSKKTTGGAEPSANALAMLALVRLDTLFSRPDYNEKARSIERCYQTLAERAPQAIGWEAYAAGWLRYPIQEVVLLQTPDSDSSHLQNILSQTPYPFRITLKVTEAQAVEAAAIIPLLANRACLHNKPTIFLCEDQHCKLPVTEAKAFQQQLDQSQKSMHSRLLEKLRAKAPELPQDAQRWFNGVASDYSNKITVIDFWTAGCINCHHLFPEIQSVKNHFSDQPVQFVGVHSSKFTQEKELSSLQHAIIRHRINHPVVMDAEHTIWDGFEVKVWPSVIIVDASGKIAYRRSGEVQSSELIAVCDRLLSELDSRKTAAPQPTKSLEPSISNLNYPTKVCISPSLTQQLQGANPYALGSRLYVSDTGNNQIKVYHLSKDESGKANALHIETWGTGAQGFQDGSVDAAMFNRPHGLSSTDTTLYIADTGNHSIRAVDLKTKEVTTLAGTGRLGRGSISEHSNPLEQDLRSPVDIDVIHQASSELLIIAMAGAHQLWLYVPDTDRVGPFLGSGLESHIDGNSSESTLAQPSAVVSVGPYLFFVDAETSSVRIYDFESRQVGTLVGEGLFDFGDIDGASEFVRLQHPMGLTAGKTELYIADTYNNKIKSIDLNGAFTRTVYGNIEGQLNEPQGITRAEQTLIVADTNNHRILCIDTENGIAHVLIQ